MQHGSAQLNNPQHPKGRHRLALFLLLAAWTVTILYLTLFDLSNRMPWVLHPDGTFLSRIAAGNLVPLRQIREYLTGRVGFEVFNYLFFGNITVFIPLGLLLPMLSGRLRRWWTVAFIGLGATAAIEFSQALLNAGMFDVDDMVLNLSGTMLGYFIWLGARRLRRART